MRRPLAGGLIAVVASLPSVATEPLCLAHSPSKCAPSSSPANAAAALKPPMGAEVLADLLDGDPSTWVPKAVALDDAGDAKASLLAFMVGSTFLSRAHFDLYYHFVAIVVSFSLIASREMDGLHERGASAMRGASFHVISPRGFQRPPMRRGFRDGLAQHPV